MQDECKAIILTKLGWHRRDLRDFEFNLVISGEPCILKNRKQIKYKYSKYKKGERVPMITSSDKAEAYLCKAAQQLKLQWYSVFKCPLPEHLRFNAAILSYLSTKRKTDASNLYEAPQDALGGCRPTCRPGCRHHAGVIVDDYQIQTHDGSNRLYDKNDPRVEITLTPYRERNKKECK
jgi:hypothetical protein